MMVLSWNKYQKVWCYWESDFEISLYLNRLKRLSIFLQIVKLLVDLVIMTYRLIIRERSITISHNIGSEILPDLSGNKQSVCL